MSRPPGWKTRRHGGGSYIALLTEVATFAGEKIGPVTAALGATACSIPFACESIEKDGQRGHSGRKRKSAKC